MSCSSLSLTARFTGLVSAITCGVLSGMTFGEELSLPKADRTAPAKTIVKKPVFEQPKAIPEDHPLAAVIQFATDEQDYLRRKVQSVRCRLTKRERIEGELQKNQFVDMDLQEEIRNGEQIERPMRVFLSFLGPGEVTGRKVLFIEGENSGKMLVRKGGKRFNYAIVRIGPTSDNAQRESLVPITELGFCRLLARQINILETHARIDPKGENTEVGYTTDAKINGRRCELIRVTHAKKQEGLTFHVANVYIDAKLHVPVRIDASDWPEKPGDKSPLIAEYTYTDLQLNVDFPEATFDADRLKQ